MDFLLFNNCLFFVAISKYFKAVLRFSSLKRWEGKEVDEGEERDKTVKFRKMTEKCLIHKKNEWNFHCRNAIKEISEDATCETNYGQLKFVQNH